MRRDGVRVFIVITLVEFSVAFAQINRDGNRGLWLSIAVASSAITYLILARFFPAPEPD